MATWDVKVVYDGAVFVDAPLGGSATFTRNKPTVDDDGAPLAANVRRFAKRSIGVQGAVNWTPTQFQLGSLGRLHASGPGPVDTTLLVGDNQVTEELYVYSRNFAAQTIHPGEHHAVGRVARPWGRG